MKNQILRLEQLAEDFLELHRIQGNVGSLPRFAIHRGAQEYDLFGTIDAVYTYYTLGTLTQHLDRANRAEAAKLILACQDEQGWFTERNLSGHSPEHSTAYAIGALCLLACDDDEDYLTQLKPLNALLPLLTNRKVFLRWIRAIGFRPTPGSILAKNLGWHYVWRGSHVGGGVPAAIGMTCHLFDQWWPGQVDSSAWFRDYFNWLEEHVNPQSGYWQLAFWNLVYHKPTLIDMGGAVHFYWIYEALERPFKHPAAIIRSTLPLQGEDGLYKDHPFCIDLDGNYCLIRPWLQLSPEEQSKYREGVYQAAEKNFEAVVSTLTTRPLQEIYEHSHGLPGALIALVECTKLPGFKYTSALSGWQHPLDKVWWL